MTPKKQDGSGEDEMNEKEEKKKMKEGLEEEMEDKDGVLEDKEYEAEVLEKEMETKTISVRSRDKGDLGAISLENFLEII